ncbi:14875_t:CDS:2 [Entrophospora sp. SA101]|nr:6973_t:CDS:2 [Entrophospora sp. SA101]CAJ0629099.1 11089_t:CDS:2 [Entrophospora sp. SA101]CAJ0755749.1 21382_t:CDS:2 [Entrophospora sp. SA101]CAJ0765601.1 14875_t:CDS:2 [Entrophospora sp. SA101]CAJ0834634.1 11829_t:CDS:2 [Entrophospora sp. SA101]
MGEKDLIPILTPPNDIQPLKSIAELESSQQLLLNQLTEFVYDNLLLPIEDSNYQREKSWLNEECLKRYLRASKWNLNDAKNRIKYSIDWRREYKPSDIDPKEVEPEVITGKIHINGFDLNGRPLVYLRPGLENTKPGPRQVRNVVFIFEAAIKLMPKNIENIVLLVDFDKCSARTSPGLGAAKEFMHVLSSHYVERLAMALVINAPWYFWSFFKLISPFIDPVTKSKIKFVDLNNSCNDKSNSGWVNLTDLIPKEQLETEYGGTNSFEYHHETYWSILLEKIGKK